MVLQLALARETPPLRLGRARTLAREWQCRISRTRADGIEYVVTPLWDTREDAKYYTNDLEDAVATAEAMWREMDTHLQSLAKDLPLLHSPFSKAGQ